MPLTQILNILIRSHLKELSRGLKKIELSNIGTKILMFMIRVGTRQIILIKSIPTIIMMSL